MPSLEKRIAACEKRARMKPQPPQPPAPGAWSDTPSAVNVRRNIPQCCPTQPAPVALISVIEQILMRVNETHKLLADRLIHVLKPYPPAGLKPESSAGSPARSSLEDVHAAITRLNETIEAIDL